MTIVKKVTISKVAYSSKPHKYVTIQDPALSGVSVAPTLQVYTVILILQIAKN
jgi:hypothetical protein